MHSLSYKTLLIILVFLLIPIVFLLRSNFLNKTVLADWWNEGWSYRIPININNTGVGQTNVYVTLTVGTSDTSRFQADGGDIRFTSNGTLLPYYLVNSSTIHVNFPTLPVGNSTIYMYYGNPSAPNGFSGADFSTAASNTTPTSSTEEIGGGPIAYWKFDEGVGTTAYDSSSNNYKAALTSTFWKTSDSCISGNCLDFDGTTSTTIANNVTKLKNSSFTVGGWMNIRSQPSIYSSMIASATTGFTLYFQQNTRKPYFQIYDGTAWIPGSCNDVANLNQWYYLVLSYDHTARIASLFLNGNKCSSDISITNGMNPNYNTSVRIGGYNSTAYIHNGLLDDIKIFPYARTATQIKQDYASGLAGQSTAKGANVNMGGSTSGKSLSDGLVGYWKFDEGTGTTSTDSSGNNNTATVTGSNNFTSGKFGTSFRSGIGSTNLILNPSFEVDASSWSSAGATLTRVTTQYQTGTAALQALWANGLYDRFYHSWITVTPSTSYTISMWLRTDNGSATPISIYASGNVTGDFTLNTFTPTSTWTRYYKTITTGASDTSIRVGVNKQGSTDATTLFIDGIQIEQTSAATPYFDGSFSTGYAWTGTAHNSTSIRYDSSATANDNDNIDVKTGSMSWSFWFKTSQDTRGILYRKSDSSNTNGVLIDINSSTPGQLKCSVHFSPQAYISSTNAIYNDNNWHYLTCTIDRAKNSLSLYIDGILDKNTDASNLNGIDLNATATAAFNSGSTYTGLLDEVRIYNRTLNPTEVTALYNFAPGPVAYYNFEEGSGNTAKDISGNNNSGTLGTGNSSPTWSTGKIGKAMTFNNAQYVQASNFINLNNDFTIGFWVKGAETATWRWLINMNNYGTGTTGGLTVTTNNNKIRWSYGTWFTEGVTSTTTTINNTSWYYFTIGRQVNQLFTYINGVSEGVPATTSVSNMSTTLPIRIGSGPNYGTDYFNGSIDDFKIYNYARTQEQILQDMQGSTSSAPKLAGPIAYYKFDEGYGSSTANWGLGGTALNATLAGTTMPNWINSGKVNRALNFDGANSYTYINSNSSLNGAKNITVSSWIYPTSNITGPIYQRGSSSAYNGYIWIWRKTTGKIYLDTEDNDTTGHKYVDGTIDIPLNTWSHIVVTIGGSDIKLYVNGKLDKSDTFSSLYPLLNGGSAYNNRENIGSWFYNTATPGNVFAGYIDEMKIYNYALSSDEIKTDYNQGASFVFGSTSQTIGGTTTSTDYCVPGDTSPCASPVGEWKFEEGVGTSTADTSGNNNLGTFGAGSSAPTWTMGKMGKGLNFNGQTGGADRSSVELGNPSSLSGMSAFTFSSWVYPLNTKTEGNILHKESSYEFAIRNGNFSAAIGTQWAWQAGPSVPNNTWSFLTGTWDGDKLYLYLNGVLTNTFDLTNGSIPTNANPIGIGLNMVSRSSSFPGKVDNIRFYNYARTPAQVAYDYNKGAPIGWWKLDDCQGTQIADWSGFANHGTLSVGGAGTQNTPGTCAVGTSAAWTNGKTGKINSSLNFDGTDDFVNITSNVPTATSGTFSLWVYPNSSMTPPGTGIYPNIVSLSSDPGIYIQATSGYPYIQTSACTLVSSKNLVANTWQHITATYNQNSTNTDCKIYINGVLTGSNSAAGNVSSTARPFSINGIGHQYQGQLDDIRIYNYALTTEQIKQVYNGGAVNFN